MSNQLTLLVQKNHQLTLLVQKKPAINPEPPLPEFSKPDTPHPMDTPMWKKMTSDVEGDGVELLQYIPNQKLVIDVQFDNTIYTITAKKK